MSAVVWQRILRILGDVNKISDPAMHHLAFQTLLNVWRRLVEVSREGERGREGKGRRERGEWWRKRGREGGTRGRVREGRRYRKGKSEGRNGEREECRGELVGRRDGRSKVRAWGMWGGELYYGGR